MLAAPVSQLPWMTSTSTIPLGKWHSGLITLLVSFYPPAKGLHPYPPTYQTVWHLELSQLTGVLRGWKHGVLGVEHLSEGMWDSNELGMAFCFVPYDGLSCQGRAR